MILGGCCGAVFGLALVEAVPMDVVLLMDPAWLVRMVPQTKRRSVVPVDWVSYTVDLTSL